jgi:hypothetical protein
MRRGFGVGVALLVIIIAVGVGIGTYNWRFAEGLESARAALRILIAADFLRLPWRKQTTDAWSSWRL